MKKQRGMTLTALAIYIVIFIAVVGLLMSLSTYITSNLQDVNKTLISSEDFNKFNVEFVNDVKQNKNAIIEETPNKVQIIFGNEINYNYIKNENAIYKNHIKVANNVAVFEAKKDIINNKTVIRITIGVGKSADNISFGKTINYVLNYWD